MDMARDLQITCYYYYAVSYIFVRGRTGGCFKMYRETEYQFGTFTYPIQQLLNGTITFRNSNETQPLSIIEITGH